MLGRSCPKALWLRRNRKNLLPEPSAALQVIFEQGHEIGRLARQRFPGGRLIGGDHTEIGKALELTRQAVKDGVGILLEPAALAEGVFIRADVLTQDPRGGWDLIEVKGAVEPKDAYLHDVAIQRHVLEGAGFPIRRACLLLINGSYVRRGDIDVSELFSLKDVTRETENLLPEVKIYLQAMREVAASAECPEVDIGDRCNVPHECAFKHFCWKDEPAGSLQDLRISTLERCVLKERGVLMIRDIPDDFELLPMQRAWVEVAKSGRPRVDRRAIMDLLAGLEYPLFFLDFEAVNQAIPPFDGMMPFHFLPFQASLHVREEPTDPLIGHVDYLGAPGVDPRPGLADFLLRNIGPKGSVVVYNKSFEGHCLHLLADAFPRQRARLMALRERLWDLAAPFRRGFYLHPGFRGSWSLKRVLPTLIPGMDYKGLAIQDGSHAQAAYLSLMRGELAPERRRQIMADLRAYCGQDTLAMVRLLDRLKQEVRG